MKRLLSILLACVLLLVGASIPADAHARTNATTIASHMEGCGPGGLTLTAYWQRVGKDVRLVSVFVDNADDMAGFALYLGVVDQDDRVLYSGAVGGFTAVGDGLDYLFVKGWERAHDGNRVRIGASELNPLGWRPIKARGLTIRASQAEARYCKTQLTLGEV